MEGERDTVATDRRRHGRVDERHGRDSEFATLDGLVVTPPLWPASSGADLLQ